jgi:hypothetical protein
MIAPSNIFVLDDVLAWFFVPLITVGLFYFITPMHWTLQKLKDSEKKLQMLLY